ncbi:hypothetical protein J7M02_07070 [Candidatus Aerophobetes bacterium]|nr:hypothetical protein [Candidatus Aerophobetes bacterium]
MVEWHPAGEGKIKDRLAIEFLTKIIEKEKKFSKAKSKTTWEKIVEVKVPEFTKEVKEGFLKYKSAMEKAKNLDEEITRIDRAIDRLVYDLYGLTKDEIDGVGNFLPLEGEKSIIFLFSPLEGEGKGI